MNSSGTIFAHSKIGGSYRLLFGQRLWVGLSITSTLLILRYFHSELGHNSPTEVTQYWNEHDNHLANKLSICRFYCFFFCQFCSEPGENVPTGALRLNANLKYWTLIKIFDIVSQLLPGEFFFLKWNKTKLAYDSDLRIWIRTQSAATIGNPVASCRANH